MSFQHYIETIRLSNFLSFEEVEVRLNKDLNILIGVNGSGKSNFLQAFNLLHALPTKFWEFFNTNGSIEDWAYKEAGTDANITVEATFNRKESDSPFRHSIEFGMTSQRRTEIFNEVIEWIAAEPTDRITTLYDYKRGSPTIFRQGNGLETIPSGEISPQNSILIQRKDTQSYPMLAILSSLYSNFRWVGLQFSLNENVRRSQRADAQNENALDTDARNLAVILNHLAAYNLDAFSNITANMKKVLPRIQGIHTVTSLGMMMPVLHEKIGGDTHTIPVQRISDGTLRFLCLLVILLSPNPPPLICIEEPEIGMHPEMLLVIAELLKEASKRTQIIVTTHSDILLSMFSETPEVVLVCEHDGEKSSIKRLNADSLKSWIEEDYRLGEMWLSNAFGGVW